MTYNAFTGSFSPSAPSAPMVREVETFADLPLDGSAPLQSAWRVKSASGIPLYNRHAAGVYVRSATGGSDRAADYTYAGKVAQIVVIK